MLYIQVSVLGFESSVCIVPLFRHFALSMTEPKQDFPRIHLLFVSLNVHFQSLLSLSLAVLLSPYTVSSSFSSSSGVQVVRLVQKRASQKEDGRTNREKGLSIQSGKRSTQTF